MEQNEPTLKELCKEYKKYRINESKKITSMTEDEQANYYANKQEDVKKSAKENKMKTVSFEEIFNEED